VDFKRDENDRKMIGKYLDNRTGLVTQCPMDLLLLNPASMERWILVG
jgi:hypothetical protein